MPANVDYSAGARGRSTQHNRERFRPFAVVLRGSPARTSGVVDVGGHQLAVDLDPEVEHPLGKPAGRLMLERRVDVAFPQIRRLDDVDVAVEHAKSGVRHDVALLSIPAMLDRMWRQPRVLCPRAAWSAAIVFRESCATTRVCLAT